MKFKQVTPCFFVSPQIQLEEIQEIAEQGFKSIICNRPDGEYINQPNFSEIEKEADRFGMKAIFFPVISGELRSEDFENFSQKLEELSGPVLAYCRSGTRSITLWSLAQLNERSASSILDLTKEAGYDMSGVISKDH